MSENVKKLGQSFDVFLRIIILGLASYGALEIPGGLSLSQPSVPLVKTYTEAEVVQIVLDIKTQCVNLFVSNGYGTVSENDKGDKVLQVKTKDDVCIDDAVETKPPLSINLK